MRYHNGNWITMILVVLPLHWSFMGIWTAVRAEIVDGPIGLSTTLGRKLFSSSSSLPVQVEQTALSIYLVASEVGIQIREKMIDPAIELWRNQEAAALERRWKMARIEEQPPSSPSSSPALSSSSSLMESSSIETPPTEVQQTEVQQPQQETNSVLSSLMKDDDDDCVAGTALTKSIQKGSKAKLTVMPVLFSPSRLGKLSMAAWLMAEVLDRLGILRGDYDSKDRTIQVRCQQLLHRISVHLKITLQALQYRIQQSNVLFSKNKDSFALGMVVGMMVSPVLTVAWQPLILIMGVAEWNALRKIQGKWYIRNAIGDGLETIRTHVRGMVSSVTSSSSSSTMTVESRDRRLQNKGGQVPLNSSSRNRDSREQKVATNSIYKGFFSWPLSRWKNHEDSESTKLQERTLFLIKPGGGGGKNPSNPSHRGLPATADRGLWRPRKEVMTDTRTRVVSDHERIQHPPHRFRELFRHGAIVGSLLGYVGGL